MRRLFLFLVTITAIAAVLLYIVNFDIVIFRDSALGEFLQYLKGLVGVSRMLV